jgi:Transport protein Trs120 or TRAPPC9, TRAPP II complex subunit
MILPSHLLSKHSRMESSPFSILTRRNMISFISQCFHGRLRGSSRALLRGKQSHLQSHASEKLAGQSHLCSRSSGNPQYSTTGVIHASYAYVHRPRNLQEDPPDVFHARQLSYPVMVTVYHMLECHGMDIIPLPDCEMSNVDSHISGAVGLQSIYDMGGEPGWCLFSIEVRNTYGLPFEVTFERHQEGARPLHWS